MILYSYALYSFALILNTVVSHHNGRFMPKCCGQVRAGAPVTVTSRAEREMRTFSFYFYRNDAMYRGLA